MPIIALPDGQNAEFPDDMPLDQIKSVIQKKFPPTQNNSRRPSLRDTTANTKLNLGGSAADLAQGGVDAAKGFGQGLLNIPSGVANLGVSGANALGANVPKVPSFDFAPENGAATTGNALSYLAGPGGMLKALAKLPGLSHITRGAMSIPLIAKGLQHAGNVLGKSPFASKVAGNAILGGAYAPDNPLLGMALGAAGPAIGRLTNTGNPLVNGIMRAVAGGGVGAIGGELTGVGPLRGAGIGATLGVGAPYAAKALGVNSLRPGLETLEHLSEEQIAPVTAAGRRLGTPLTPAEASGNPFTGRQEGRYGRTGEAAAEKTKIGMEKVKNEKAAVDNLLDTIYDKSELSNQKIRDLYAEAYKSNLPQETVESFKEDPVIAKAFDDVLHKPGWQRKLKGINENNYAYLDKVKKAISDEEGKLIRSGENEQAREYTEARTHLTKIMDEINPSYKAAREEAQKSIVRTNLQKVLKTKEIKGSTFYNTVLRNENKFEDLMSSLKNVPEAQEKLRDMRLAWKNLINIEKPGTSAYREETGLNQSRNAMSKLVDIWNEMTGSKRNLKALKFIHSPEWDKSFKELQKIKDSKKRNEAFSNLIEKVGSISAIETLAK